MTRKKGKKVTMKTTTKNSDKLTWMEEDAGLWIIRQQGEQVAAIFDGGHKISGEKGSGWYDALDGWYQHVPGNFIARGVTFWEALSHIRKWVKAGRPQVTALPEYHPEWKRLEAKATERLMKAAEFTPTKGMSPIAFAILVSRLPGDALWQEEFFKVREQARQVVDDYCKI